MLPIIIVRAHPPHCEVGSIIPRLHQPCIFAHPTLHFALASYIGCISPYVSHPALLFAHPALLFPGCISPLRSVIKPSKQSTYRSNVSQYQGRAPLANASSGTRRKGCQSRMSCGYSKRVPPASSRIRNDRIEQSHVDSSTAHWSQWRPALYNNRACVGSKFPASLCRKNLWSRILALSGKFYRFASVSL